MRSAGPQEASAGTFSPPRLVSEPHPRAAGSLGTEWAAWIEGNLLHPRTRKPLVLLPAQRLVLDRALEIDVDGRLCWSEVVVSAPRQVMKSVLLYVVAAARAAHSEHFGEQQLVLHVANKLVAARRIHAMAWPWAIEAGLHVSKALDSATIRWPDDSSWIVSSLSAAWGTTSTAAMVDEAWDIPPEVVEDALLPTLVSVEQPQLWLYSCANAEATATYVRARRRAQGSDRTMIAEWSADRDADKHDPAVWRAASPVWTPQREATMRSAQDTPGFAEQWLNIWPDVTGAVEGWPVGWAGLPSWPSPPRSGLVATVETSRDLSRFGVAVAEQVNGRVVLHSRGFDSLEGALAQLRAWQPATVLAGASLVADVVGPWLVDGLGVKETGWATPVLADLVRRGRLAHDHDQRTASEVEHARVTQTEAGPLLSARRSDGPIPTVKALTWAAWAAVDARFAPVRAEIW